MSLLIGGRVVEGRVGLEEVGEGTGVMRTDLEMSV